MKIPKPPTPLTGAQYATLPQGSMLHRVHRTTFGAAQFNPGRGGPTRFAPLSDSAGRPVPSLYAASTLRAAIHETIFHDIPARAMIKTVRRNDVQSRTHSELLTVRDLRLVELRSVTLGSWGISRRDLISSCAAQFGQTVLWAEAIHHSFPDADGLVWTSNQCDPDDACLLFGDRVWQSDFRLVRSRDGGRDKSFEVDVRSEGQRRGITLTI